MVAISGAYVLSIDTGAGPLTTLFDDRDTYTSEQNAAMLADDRVLDNIAYSRVSAPGIYSPLTRITTRLVQLETGCEFAQVYASVQHAADKFAGYIGTTQHAITHTHTHSHTHTHMYDI